MPRRFPVFFLVLAMVLVACTDTQKGHSTRVVAPGDRAALEQLADAWSEVAEQWPTAPMRLLPEGRRKFVEQVFTTAGYSYTRSLLETGKIPLDPFNSGQKNLCELLLTPARGLADKDLGVIYSPEELAAISSIRKTFP